MKDLSWIRKDAKEMTEEDWHDPKRHDLGMLIHGQATDEVDEWGHPLHGDTILLLVNGGPRSCHFRLPTMAQLGRWEETINTARPGTRMVRREGVTLARHSLILLTYRVAR